MDESKIIEQVQEAIKTNLQKQEAKIAVFKQEIAKEDSSIHYLINWKAMDAVAAEFQWRCFNGLNTWLSGKLTQADPVTLENIEKNLKQEMEEITGDLTSGSSWRHNSTSAISNCINEAESEARVQLLQTLKWELQRIDYLKNKEEKDNG